MLVKIGGPNVIDDKPKLKTWQFFVLFVWLGLAFAAYKYFASKPGKNQPGTEETVVKQEPMKVEKGTRVPTH